MPETEVNSGTNGKSINLLGLGKGFRKALVSRVPAESFETGIKKTIKWYSDNSGWVKRVKSGEYMSWIKQQYDL